MNSKIKAYIGFAINKGAVIYGADNILSAKRKPKLIVICKTASEKTKKEVKYYCSKNGILLLESAVLAEKIVLKAGVKVFALTDENLASAILQNLDKDFKSVEVVT